MYSLSDEQVEFLRTDIRRRGVYHESLCDDLLDHICCMLEEKMQSENDFGEIYKTVISSFGEHGLRGVQDETNFVLTQQYYRPMKKIMFASGVIASITIILGATFKIQHWAGAGVMLVAGSALFGLIFLPLLFLIRFKEAGERKDKVVTLIGLFTALLVTAATLMRVMHWPWGSVLSVVSFTVFFVAFLPLYFINGYRNPLTRYTTVGNTFIMASLGGLMLMLGNHKQSMAMNMLLQESATQQEKTLQNVSTENHAVFQKLNSSPEKDDRVAKIETALHDYKTIVDQYRSKAIEVSNDTKDEKVINYYAKFYPGQTGISASTITEKENELHKALAAVNGKTYAASAVPGENLLGKVLMDLTQAELEAEQEVSFTYQYLLGKSGK